MALTPQTSSEVDRLLRRLDDDAEFRYGFSLDPDAHLREFQLTDLERKLLGTRDQDDWFAYLYGGSHATQKYLNVVTVKVVTVKVAQVMSERLKAAVAKI
jgi:hypothetical protein